MKKILFIGGGNMAKAIISGITKNGYPDKNISVVDRNIEKCNDLLKTYGVNTYTECNDEIVASADIIVLAIKPQGAELACNIIKQHLHGNLPELLISVMAGITIDSINSWFGDILPIVRAMPNTPSIVQHGATGLFCKYLISEEQTQFINTIFNSIGKSAWLNDEEAINSITALSGSGPAYIFLILEYMQNQAIRMGLNPEISKEFALQTVLGAAELAKHQNIPFSILRERVTSKGGTTHAAIESMQDNNLESVFSNGMLACKERASELSRLYGSKNGPIENESVSSFRI